MKSTDAELEQGLRCDPAGVYALMDDETRARYRDVTTQLAGRGRVTPAHVASAAIELARNHADSDAEPERQGDRRRHVGYWLIGKGRTRLARQLGIAVPWRWRAKDCHPNGLLAIYAGAVVLGALALALGMLATFPGTTPFWLRVLCLTTVVIAASHVSVSLCNQVTGKVFSPERLPRLDLSTGVPEAFRTLLVVPCLLVSRPAIEGLITKLEQLYLANREDHLAFCLVTDFCDAEQEVTPADAELVACLEHGIRLLNMKHGERFGALHRARKWNDRDRLWMGWERKRGKLEELNAFLMGENDDAFPVRIGAPSLYRRPRFVLTLDDDMELPSNGARRLISVLAHPLNQPLRDPATGAVVDGYGVLQPAMYVPLDVERSSRYVRLYSSGLNSVTNAVKPDLYQDLLALGTFNGKGLYDLETFHRRLHGQMPENQVLSHDMLEGSYIRSALVTDIQVPEEFPSTYLGNMARRHRWWRGDWQNIKWLLPSIRLAPGKRIRNPISAVGYWRVIDNARRVVFPGMLLASLLLGWLLSEKPTLWSVMTAGILFVPILTSMLLAAMQKRRTEQLVFGSAITRSNWVVINFLNLAFLIYEARLATGALLMSSYRMFVSKRGLLEWTPSSEVNLKPVPSLAGYYVVMWTSPVFALIIAAALWAWRPEALLAAAPILLVWMIAPCIAHWISRKPKPAARSQKLDPQGTF